MSDNTHAKESQNLGRQAGNDLGPSRRELLLWGGASAIGMALGPACADPTPGTADTQLAADALDATADQVGDAGDSTIADDADALDALDDSTQDIDPSETADATDAPDGTDVADIDAGPPALLSGGTASFTGEYRDPFVDGPNPSCELTCEQTGGPCYATSPFRKDISAGIVGLPMRLALRIRAEGSCTPVANADVELWGCDVEGVYSGDTPSPICAGDDTTATALDFMRGRQNTNASGRVDFDLVLPGWYPTRAPHLHVRVNVGGNEFVTSQFYFEDATVGPIYETHPDYAHRGTHATTLPQDGVIGGESPAAPFIPSIEITPEGAMLGWIDVVLRSNLADPSCLPED